MMMDDVIETEQSSKLKFNRLCLVQLLYFGSAISLLHSSLA